MGLLRELTDGGVKVRKYLANITGASAADDLAEIAQRIPRITENLRDLESERKKFLSNIGILNHGILVVSGICPRLMQGRDVDWPVFFSSRFGESQKNPLKAGAVLPQRMQGLPSGTPTLSASSR